jgi:hypothetical protein
VRRLLAGRTGGRRVAPPPRWEQLRRDREKTDQKEEGVDRGPNKPKPKRGSAFEKLQSEREAKGVEEDLERDVEERQERKQIRQEMREESEQIRREEREEREQVRQEAVEERKREREKARGQEESS